MGLHVQYNEEHYKQKRGGQGVAKPQPRRPVTAPFDSAAFHFLKAREDETLMHLQFDGETMRWSLPGAGRLLASGDELLSQRHSLLINASPLFEGHTLFVPAPHMHLPQVATATSFELAARAVSLTGRADGRMIFNSLGGWASVNHLHFHILYLDGDLRPEDERDDSVPASGRYAPLARFPVERHGLAAEPLGTLPGGVLVSATAPAWPLRSYVFHSSRGDANAAAGGAGGATGPPGFVAAAAAAGRLCSHLAERGEAHNAIFFPPRPAATVAAAPRAHPSWPSEEGCVLVVPRRPQGQSTALGAGMNIASVEAGGLGIAGDNDTYQGLSEDRYVLGMRQSQAEEAGAPERVLAWVADMAAAEGE